MSLPALRAALSRGPSFSPFVVLGDPTPEISVILAGIAARNGGGMLEIGFPYSDPVADGPAVQAAASRALAGGTSTRSALGILRRISSTCPGTPLNLLVYGNLVHRIGWERFALEAVAAGASSLLTPDVPFDEAGPLRSACRRAGLGQVELAGPLTPEDRLRRLAESACFVYLAGFQGVTGVRSAGFQAMLDRLREVRTLVEAPLCLGFGLSHRRQITAAFEAGAKITVVGSHLARIVERLYRDPGDEDRLLTAYRDAVRRLAGLGSGKDETEC